MEIATIKISKELLQILVDSEAITTNDFEVKIVEESSFDYSKDEAWQLLKTKSHKAYKEVKQREFELRHMNKK